MPELQCCLHVSVVGGRNEYQRKGDDGLWQGVKMGKVYVWMTESLCLHSLRAVALE